MNCEAVPQYVGIFAHMPCSLAGNCRNQSGSVSILRVPSRDSCPLGQRYVCVIQPLWLLSLIQLYSQHPFLGKAHWYLCLGRGPGLSSEMLPKAISPREKPYKGIHSTTTGDPGRQSPTLDYRSLPILMHGMGTLNPVMLTKSTRSLQVLAQCHCASPRAEEGTIPRRIQAHAHLVHPIVQGHDCQVFDVLALFGTPQLYEQVMPSPVRYPGLGQLHGCHIRGAVGDLKADVAVENL